MTDDMNERSEIELKCPNCTETHGHICFEPVPVDTFFTTCPNCSERNDHDVIGRIW